MIVALILLIMAVGLIRRIWTENNISVTELEIWRDKTHPIVIMSSYELDDTVEERAAYARQMLEQSGNVILKPSRDIHVIAYEGVYAGKSAAKMSFWQYEIYAHKKALDILEAWQVKAHAANPDWESRNLRGQKI
jgi:hypothetical protein